MIARRVKAKKPQKGVLQQRRRHKSPRTKRKWILTFGFAGDGSEKLDKYFEEWLEVYKKPNVKPITYTVQERNVRLNILPRFGHYKLKNITRSDYQKWINELREHYSAGTVRRIHSIMSCAMNDEDHEFNILRENPIVKK